MIVRPFGAACSNVTSWSVAPGLAGSAAGVVAAVGNVDERRLTNASNAATPASASLVAPASYLPNTATTLSAPSSQTRSYSGYFPLVFFVLTVAFAAIATTSLGAIAQPAAAGR